MAFTRKNLAFGQLPAAKGDLYSPSGVNGLVHNLLFHNDGVSTERIRLYLHDSVNEYLLFNFEMEPDETVLLDFKNEGCVVMDGEKLTGYTDTATQVTYKFDGSEES